MEVWDWNSFWGEFTLPVLVASLTISALVMIVKWLWSRKRPIVLWFVLWVATAIFLGIFMTVLRPDPVSDGEMETRPYFTKSHSAIGNISTDDRAKVFILTVSVQNNNRPAKNVISQLMLLDERLDPTIEPLRTRRVENANDIGRFQILSQHTPVTVRATTRAAFVVFEIGYTDALTNETYSQLWFMKFQGASRDGTFIQQLFEASYDERTRIESYIEQRNIPTLAVLGG